MTQHQPLLTPATDAGTRVAAGAFLVDVRSEAGRATAGAIPGATVTDREDLDAIFGAASAPAVSLDTPIVVVCGSERGSGPVAEALAARGYTDVSHVAGGFPAWRDAGLPAEPGTGAASSGPHEPVRQRA
ncbi:sulfurtransferase [Oerskovia sp. Sa1BUA8]|uniref:Sulfurtransferase n=1 Tax=Oerskovia douganii TaxID=2762210 RepID=A0A9D5UA84_9CELL|nr:rhodanese-like domain-containing protein [Oerskovia douganii]MBE7701175.1 sulfurtransferase [Oerskovia douganii]